MVDTGENALVMFGSAQLAPNITLGNPQASVTLRANGNASSGDLWVANGSPEAMGTITGIGHLSIGSIAFDPPPTNLPADLESYQVRSGQLQGQLTAANAPLLGFTTTERQTSFCARAQEVLMNAFRIGSSVLFGLIAFAACAPFNAAPRTATAIISDVNGQTIGTAKFTETASGTRVSLRVKGLTMGRHGTHLHENASCADTKDAKGNPVKFGGAGAHFDPMDTMKHGSPYGTDHTNHAGDLENTVVDEDGDGYVDMTDRHITVSPGVSSIIGRSIIIHANEDGFTNEPVNGGSGARIACGVIALSN